MLNKSILILINFSKLLHKLAKTHTTHKHTLKKEISNHKNDNFQITDGIKVTTNIKIKLLWKQRSYYLIFNY